MIRTASSKAAFGVLSLAAAAAIAPFAAGPIAAADTGLPQAGSESADATIRDIQDAGFDVQINYTNGHPNVPLSECKVTNVNNPNGAMASMLTLSTVYVDINCANAK